MSIIHDIAEALQDILTTGANTAAKESGFVQRKSTLDGPAFVQTLVFGFLANPDATGQELEQTAIDRGIEVTESAIVQRYSATSAEFMRLIVQQAIERVITADPAMIPLLNRFSHVIIQDSTTVGLPNELAEIWAGCGSSTKAGSAALKCQLAWDLCTGQLHGIELQNGRDSDRASQIRQDPIRPWSLYLADLGYFKLAHFEEIGKQDAYWITRIPAGLVVYDADGKRWNDVTDLLEHVWNGEIIDIAVQLGSEDRLDARLLAIRATEEVVAQRRRRLRAVAQKHGRTPSKRQLAMCAWTILATNLPRPMASGDDVVVLARARWQIELVFKLWKSEGRLDKTRSAKPYRILTELYAKLVALLIQHWICLIELWQSPNRSLMKACKTIRKHALHLASVFDEWVELVKTIAKIGHTISFCCTNQRKESPSTYQLLLDSSLQGWENNQEGVLINAVGCLIESSALESGTTP